MLQAATRTSCLGKNCAVCALISARSSAAPGQSGMLSDRFAHQRLQTRLGAADAQFGGGVGPQARGVLADRLAEFLGVAEHVAQVVGDLIGFAELGAERRPGVRVGAGGRRARPCVAPTNRAPVLAR